MSNWIRAYGWSGHTIASSDDTDSDPSRNLVAIAPEVFARIAADYGHAKLNPSIRVEQLGVTEHDCAFLACGPPASFAEAFSTYSAIFQEAELQAEHQPLAVDFNAEYLRAMKEVYGIDLPPCRLMVGCSMESEH